MHVATGVCLRLPGQAAVQDVSFLWQTFHLRIFATQEPSNSMLTNTSFYKFKVGDFF